MSYGLDLYHIGVNSHYYYTIAIYYGGIVVTHRRYVFHMAAASICDRRLIFASEDNTLVIGESSRIAIRIVGSI